MENSCLAITKPYQNGLGLSSSSSPVIHSFAAGGNGVRRLHLVSLAVSARLHRRGKPDAQPLKLMLKYGDGSTVRVVADQAEVQIPALRAAVGSLNPARNAVAIAWCDHVL